MTDTQTPRNKRLLITGDRNWSVVHPVAFVLGAATMKGYGLLIHGDARGADTLAARIALAEGWTGLSFPADWRRYGRSAGPRRNIEMLAQRPDAVVAFHDDLEHSRGTGHMVRLARKGGVPAVHFSHLHGWRRIP